MNTALPTTFLLSGLFGEQLIGGTGEAPLMARLVAAVTPEVAKQHVVLAEGSSSEATQSSLIGEELAHLLFMIEDSLRDAAPGQIEVRNWNELIARGEVYQAYEELRHEAGRQMASIQLMREVGHRVTGRRVKVQDLLIHVTECCAQARGKLLLMLELAGIKIECC